MDTLILKIVKHLFLITITQSYRWNNLKEKWNEEFELPDGSYSVLDIQDYFEHILKKHGEKIEILQ